MGRRLHLLARFLVATIATLLAWPPAAIAQAPPPAPAMAEPEPEPPGEPPGLLTMPGDPTPQAQPEPGAMRLPPTAQPEPEAGPEQDPAPLDPRVRPVAEAAPDDNPLPPASPKAGTPVPMATPAVPPDGYKPTPDRIPIGKQTASLSVEVISPGVMNVNQAGTIKIVVRNTGVADAMSVRVNYDLAKELDLVASQPKEQRLSPADPGLQWALNTVAAGSEQVITLRVMPKAVTTIDHAALVTLMVGGRSRTVIQEPMLKVEQSATPSKVLQGQQVQFRIAVSNPGSGPARNVVVRARFSPGLKHQGEDVVEQVIDVIQAQQRIELDPLVLDTLAGGEQTCTITAMSEDIATPSADSKNVRSVVVLRPELAVDLVGPETRYTDTLAEYTVNVDNPGTAAARNVVVAVTLPPNSGRLQRPLPVGSEWNPNTNRLTWTIPNIEPKAKSTAKVLVRLGGIGAYRVVAEAKAGPLSQTDAVLTDVSGIADVDLQITERKRVLDVGDSTIFDVRIKNLGTKAAKNILLRAKLSENVEVTETAGLDEETQAFIEKDTGDLVFPRIAALVPGRELVVSIKVNALKAGSASCRIYLMHDDILDLNGRLEDIAHTRVTGTTLR